MRQFIETNLEKLSPRDKKLLAAMYMFFGLAGLVLLTVTLVGMQRAMEAEVRNAKVTYRAVLDEQDSYDIANAKLTAQKARLEQSAGKALSAHVEEIATDMGIDEGLKDATRGEQVEESGIVSTKWRVALKGRTYEEAVQFMLRLENSNYPLRIENARFKKVKVKRELRVDLNLDVLTYKIGET